MRRKTILVVDDEAIWRNLLCRLLTPAGYRVITAPSGACGLQAARAGEADCVILDYNLRDGTAALGFESVLSVGREVVPSLTRDQPACLIF